MSLLLVVAVSLLVSVALYAALERRYRPRWRSSESGRVAVEAGAGAYRDAGSVPLYFDRAPPLLRAAALSSIVLAATVFVGTWYVHFPRPVRFVLGPVMMCAFYQVYMAMLLLERTERGRRSGIADSIKIVLYTHGLVLAGAPVVAVAYSQLGWRVGAVAFASFVIVAQTLFVRSVAKRYELALQAP
jgi:hypothetical protein